jgi:hypothetical protein
MNAPTAAPNTTLADMLHARATLDAVREAIVRALREGAGRDEIDALLVADDRATSGFRDAVRTYTAVETAGQENA